jgi:hypothetical protein
MHDILKPTTQSQTTKYTPIFLLEYHNIHSMKHISAKAR